MSQVRYTCGPNATETYDDNITYQNTTNPRLHRVSGTGVINKNHAGWYKAEYLIESGIVELSDKCFNSSYITKVTLPKTLVKIGNSCFNNTAINEIILPESLKSIGNNNFPTSLKSINIPSLLEYFPLNNIENCSLIEKIIVHVDNKFYKSIDGILYNYDVTKLLFCPRGKSGNVIIPESVISIEDDCFKLCYKITSIQIPYSVKKIGNRAFSYISLEKLNIPNSVLTIGEKCFEGSIINKSFKFSANIKILPHYAFNKSKLPSWNFIKNIESIGDYCFNNANISLSYLDLPKIVHIGINAFEGNTNIKIIELYSCLTCIKANAFKNISSDLIIKYNSLIPINLPENAFENIGNKAKLLIPQNTKLIFENTIPWSIFSVFEEVYTNHNITSSDVDISDNLYLTRLLSITKSIDISDRSRIQNILLNLSQSYETIDSNEEFEEALNLIKYNYLFTPPIISNLDKSMSLNWINKYKLNLIEKYIFEINSQKIKLNNSDERIEINNTDVFNMNIPKQLVTLEIESKPKMDICKVYFENIFKILQEELSQARLNIKIAVSWFTNYKLFCLLKELQKKGIKIQLITNNDLINNGGYCLNLNELINDGVEVSLVEYPNLLHHKFCIIDNYTIINGSYNWTRFSEKNYENIMVVKNNDTLISSFNLEFAKLFEMAKYKCISTMPDIVPNRPEYDRSAFKQYITEELDIKASEETDTNIKTEILHQANKLNSKYLSIINPNIEKTYSEMFTLMDHKDSVEKTINRLSSETNTFDNNDNILSKGQLTTNTRQSEIKQQIVSPLNENSITQIMISSILMAIDVSGSMENTFKKGHVHRLTKKVLATSLLLSKTKNLNLWSFGSTSEYISTVGLNNLNEIEKIKCQNTNTNLYAFINKVSTLLEKDSFVIILTDDDANSIKQALPKMTNIPNTFWQILSYEKSCPQITNSIKNIPNISLALLMNYESLSDEQLQETIIKDYLQWKKQNKID